MARKNLSAVAAAAAATLLGMSVTIASGQTTGNTPGHGEQTSQLSRTNETVELPVLKDVATDAARKRAILEEKAARLHDMLENERATEHALDTAVAEYLKLQPQIEATRLTLSAKVASANAEQQKLDAEVDSEISASLKMIEEEKKAVDTYNAALTDAKEGREPRTAEADQIETARKEYVAAQRQRAEQLVEPFNAKLDEYNKWFLEENDSLGKIEQRYHTSVEDYNAKIKFIKEKYQEAVNARAANLWLLQHWVGNDSNMRLNGQYCATRDRAEAAAENAKRELPSMKNVVEDQRDQFERESERVRREKNERFEPIKTERASLEAAARQIADDVEARNRADGARTQELMDAVTADLRNLKGKAEDAKQAIQDQFGTELGLAQIGALVSGWRENGADGEIVAGFLRLDQQHPSVRHLTQLAERACAVGQQVRVIRSSLVAREQAFKAKAQEIDHLQSVSVKQERMVRALEAEIKSLDKGFAEELEKRFKNEMADRLEKISRDLEVSDKLLKMGTGVTGALGAYFGSTGLVELSNSMAKLSEKAGDFALMVKGTALVADRSNYLKAFPYARDDKKTRDWLEKFRSLLSVEKHVEATQHALDFVQVGVVDAKSPEYMVSAEDFVADIVGSTKKLDALERALEQNVSRLESLKETLPELARRAKAASKGLNAMHDAYLRLLRFGGGAFFEYFALEGMNASELACSCNGIEATANQLNLKVTKALAEEKLRLEALRANLETIYGNRGGK